MIRGVPLPPPPLLIVADNYRLAWQYARDHDLGPERRGWRYVSEPSQVLGMAGGRYVTVSTGAAEGQDLQRLIEVERALRMRGFKYGCDSTDPST